MTAAPRHRAPRPPGWVAKPLRAMDDGELSALRTVLARERPPDCALLRAVDRQLAGAAAEPDASDDWSLDP